MTVGNLFITPEGGHLLKKYSKCPISQIDTLSLVKKGRMKIATDTDALLVSFKDKVTKDVLGKFPNLKYIGICATSTDNVDLATARLKGIVVTNVMRYGDEGPAEYIFSQLLNIVRGFGKYQWKDMPSELFGKTIGIVGMGPVGRNVLSLALGFNMHVVYTSKIRKREIESEQVKFLTLNELITQSDIVSLHVPKDTLVFGNREFDLMTPGKILINTCLGKVFKTENFKKWISKKENYAIFDRSTSDDYFKELKGLHNVIFPNVIAGYTLEARERLTQKVVVNIENYLGDVK